MKTKQITNKLDEIVKGLNQAADVVKSTMGGQGKTVIIASNDNREKLRFTKDGVSVAKAIELENPIENIGAQILISAANKTVEQCGDGTTLTSVLLQSMIGEALKKINKGSDINKLFSNLENSLDKVLKELDKEATKVETVEDIKNVATTATNSTQIGNLFKEIFGKTGLDARVTLEKSEDSPETYYDIKNGIEFDSGFVHSSFMTNKDTEQAIYENAYIHLDENPISTLTPSYEELLSAAVQHRIPLIIIAPRFSDAFIRTCSMNKVNKAAPICLIKTPGYGYGQKKNMDDIRAFLNSEGGVDKIMVDSYKFILYNDDTPMLQNRIEQLKSLSVSAFDKYDEEDYLQRIYNLKCATAIIYAGGKTPEAMQEEYDRIDDAIGSVQAAIRSGYVAGGGVTLAKLALTMRLNTILKEAMLQPIAQIAKNANVRTVQIDASDPKGYNVRTHTYEDFLKTGIIDAVDVLKYALQNAFANTKLLVNTSFALYNEYNNSI